jgi:hypothetical protein
MDVAQYKAVTGFLGRNFSCLLSRFEIWDAAHPILYKSVKYGFGYENR